MGRVVRYFLDTEFWERGHEHPIQLISLGLVSDDGRQYYAETADVDRDALSEWLKANVVPRLTGPRVSRARMKLDVLEFIGADRPEFWAYFADYDWVVFCQLFGTMIDLPKTFPQHCMDLKQRMEDLGLKRADLPAQPASEHHALADALWVKRAADHLDWLEVNERDPERN
jgi:hypothetical protein